jgi:hypothetical protein
MSYTATQKKGVYKTQYGKYRVRKAVNGVKISRNFSKYREACNFMNDLNQAND